MTPAGLTMFCACSAAIKDPRSMPRVASSAIENSMKICSSWAPRISILETSGSIEQLRANVLDVVAELARREAVRGEAVDDPERVAELVVEEGPKRARRQRVLDVADTLAHMIPNIGDFLGCGVSL